MQPKDFQEEVKQASDKLARVKKRRSDVQIPSPLTIVSEMTRVNVVQYDGNGIGSTKLTNLI